ncbi:MAG TPA: uroporphyrinogen-III C-methyltransferase [Steroidobacteraceae bacterium]|nr:uroporphyrinogen-III C-methyltransferase [Steroidobacteraceae bacterium]
MTNEIESLTTDNSARRTGSGVSPLWFAFAGLALLLALYAHWRFGQFDERIDRLRAQVVEVRAAQDRLDSEAESLNARLEQATTSFRDQIRDLREVPTRVGELGRTVAELRARTEAPQRAWVRAEALYLLELGARRLALEHDVPTAIAAMESADARLATVTDPAVAEVRAQLARELQALRAVDVPDVPKIIERLIALETQAEDYRVLGVPVAQARRLGEDDAGEFGAFDRAMNRLAQAWHDLFSYRRVDPGMSRLVTREEESLRRQHLELLFFAARVAAMQQDRPAYLQSLQAATDWLDRFFDGRHAGVAAAREELAALAAIDVDPARPKVGAAAQLLQRVIGAGSAAAAP